jgi:hypothetical protein
MCNQMEISIFSPKYGIICTESEIYHLIDLEKNFGTRCNLLINQNMRLFLDIPEDRILCPNCATNTKIR